MDVPFPKTTITFTFSVSPKELAAVARDFNTILNLPDSRPAPKTQESGYIHNIGAGLTPQTHKIIAAFLSQADPEDLNFQ